MSSDERPQFDQIDLFDIIRQLWAGKKTIFISVVACIILAAIYAFTAQEKWTSTAIITLPDSGQVSAYTQAENVLYPRSAPSTREIQNAFFKRFQGGIAALSIQLQNQEEKEELSSEEMSKDQRDQIKISYVGLTSKDAQTKLNEYLKKVDSSIVTDVDGDLDANIKARTNELKDAISSLEKVAKQKKDDRLHILNQALIIAKQSNIEEPQLNNSSVVTDDTLFSLGSNALTSMIDNYKNAPLPLDSDYYSTMQNLLSVESLNQNKRIISTFRYIMKPNLPIRKDSPKKAIILIISVLFGGVLGSGYVLTKNFIQKEI
ncbi:LPS O-antigen chain length determinant protein WzzB [Mangrovibacter sp. SLW1]